MALRFSENDENSNLNPGHNDYEQKFNALDKAEKQGTTQGNAGKSPFDSIKDAEESPSKGWKNNVTGAVADMASGGKLRFVKKKGPIAVIIVTILGLGVSFMGISGSSMLIVNFKEMLTKKFNLQFTSMDARTVQLYSAKTTKGFGCGTLVSIGCKYSTMSDKQIANFEEAGIKVNGESKNILGRTKPESFDFNGETIGADDFKAKMVSDPEFGAAVQKGYNPKFSGFADKIFAWVEGKLGITKSEANLSGDTDAEQLASLQEDTAMPNEADEAAPVQPETTDSNGQPLNADDAASAQNAANGANDILEGAQDVAENNASAAASAAEEIAETEARVLAMGPSTAVSALKATGLADGACTVYGTAKAIGYAAKTVRAIQLARYAMVFLNVADQIKAGSAKEKDVNYLGKTLTTPIKSEDGTMKTATDSFGYKYAAYNERGKMSTSASRYLAGGGFAGLLIGITTMINDILGKNPDKACKFFKNPFVGIGSLLVGIGMFLVPGANVAWSAKQIAQTAAIVALNVAAIFLPALLKDVIAGVLVDNKTVGEAAGDALTSGASGLMGASAKAGGNAPLTPDQAVAYQNLTNETLARYARQDIATHSPFDASNSNTFMGRIVAYLIPYTTRIFSPTSALTSISSLALNSFSQISPITKAASVDEFNQCQDSEYKSLDLATDPYCNVRYGIPPDALNEDPIKVAEALVNSNEIDPSTGDAIPGSKYETFINDCINRTNPLGDTGQNSQSTDGSECKFSPQNKNYYLHYIDQRVQAGMDGEDVNVASSTSPTTPGMTPVSNPISGAATICVDAGHPPQGAPGEPEYALKTAKALQTELQNRGYKVIMTRTDSSSVSIQDRPQKCSAGKANFMYSIHGENDGSASNHPFTIYMKNSRSQSANSKKYADTIQKAIVASLKGSHGMLGKQGICMEGSCTALANLGIFRGADDKGIPAVISEVVRSNDNGTSAIDDSDYLRKLVLGIANGIEQIFPLPASGGKLVYA